MKVSDHLQPYNGRSPSPAVWMDRAEVIYLRIRKIRGLAGAPK